MSSNLNSPARVGRSSLGGDARPPSSSRPQRAPQRRPAHALPVADNVISSIGDTPLVRLRRLLDRPDLSVYAKIEAANPGGSIKDRPAARMIESALRSGRIGPSTVVVESSSGNTAIGLAQVCRYHGLRLICVIDPRTQPTNLAIMRAYGAEIDVVTDDGSDWLERRIARVQEICEREGDVFWTNQYANPDNPAAHEHGTMREIADALDGRVDVVVAAASSTGTLGGCTDYIERTGLSTSVVAVDADHSVLFGGPGGNRLIPGMGAGIEPPLATGRSFDRVERVSALDCVFGCRRLVEREAILAGGSSGGVVVAAGRLEATVPFGATIALILADSGTRYLETVYSDDWVRRHLGVQL